MRYQVEHVEGAGVNTENGTVKRARTSPTESATFLAAAQSAMSAKAEVDEEGDSELAELRRMFAEAKALHAEAARMRPDAAELQAVTAAIDAVRRQLALASGAEDGMTTAELVVSHILPLFA